MKKKIFITFILCCTAFIVSAQIINVPADQPTIQNGIDAATNGDTVLVADGTYLENINFMKKAITVASNFIMDGDTNHISNTIIDGSQPSNPDFGSVVTLNTGEDTTSVLSGFTITGGTGLYLSIQLGRMGGGVACYLAGAKITDNKIINNTVSNISYPYGGGIGYMSGNSSGWIVILDNTIKDNTVVADEHETFAGGIYVMGNARIESNVIHNNYCHLLSASGEIQGGGLYAESSTSTPLNTLILNNNIIQNNILEGGDEAVGGGVACGDFFLCPVSFITNNTIVNNTILGVETGWGSGVYLKKIHGDILISGNIIQFNSVISNSAGGTAIYVDQPISKVKILNNLISDNWATSGINYAWAAAIWLWDSEGAYVVVDGNIIENNTGNRAGGFYARNSYNFHLTNNIFDGNNVDLGGGAVHLFQYYGNSNEVFPEGVPAHTSHNPIVTKAGSIRPVIANNTFTDNHIGQDGGAIYITNTYDSLCPVIFNNIFWGNEVSTGNGKDIYHLGDEYLMLKNNNIDTALIHGNWEGDGNIFEDPIFIDPTNGDFHLDPNSPCAGKGIDSLNVGGANTYFCPLFDFENDPRPLPAYNMPDMGADEVDEAEGIAQLIIKDSGLKIQNYPNPFSTSTTIEYELHQTANVEIMIFNHLGQQIEKMVRTDGQKGKYQITWNASNLPNGIYFVRVRAGREMATGKVVKIQ